jgi:hypothetical protein
VPLFASVLPCSFVVCLASDEVVIYKVFKSGKKNKLFNIFHSALFSEKFYQVSVLHSEKKLARCLLATPFSLEQVKIKIIE